MEREVSPEEFSLPDTYVNQNEIISSKYVPVANSSFDGSEFRVCDSWTKENYQAGDNALFNNIPTYNYYSGYDGIYELRFLVPKNN